MKGKSSLREEGHGVRGEIKGAIFPPRRESSPGASPNLGEGLPRGDGGAGGAGGRCWGPGLEEAAGLWGRPWSHTGTFQLSKKGVDAKRRNPLPQCPKPHILCVIQQETSWGGGAAPLELRLRWAVGHGGPWDAKGDGYGEPCSLLGLGDGGGAPSPRPAAAISLWGAEPSDGRGQNHISDRPQPSLPLFLIHLHLLRFLLNNGPW